MGKKAAYPAAAMVAARPVRFRRSEPGEQQRPQQNAAAGENHGGHIQVGRPRHRQVAAGHQAEQGELEEALHRQRAGARGAAPRACFGTHHRLILKLLEKPGQPSAEGRGCKSLQTGDPDSEAASVSERVFGFFNKFRAFGLPQARGRGAIIRAPG